MEVVALYDYKSDNPTERTFRNGEIIKVSLNS